MLTITSTRSRRHTWAAVLGTLAAHALPASVSAHGVAGPPVKPYAKRGTVVLRGCWMTVAYVRRAAEVLAKDFPTPPLLGQIF